MPHVKSQYRTCFCQTSEQIEEQREVIFLLCRVFESEKIKCEKIRESSKIFWYRAVFLKHFFSFHFTVFCKVVLLYHSNN